MIITLSQMKQLALRVASALSTKQLLLRPDSSVKLTEDGEIGVSLPTRSVTQAEYDGLGEEEKAETLFIITDAEAKPLEGVTITEYETDDGWHVRKWSDGYLEMSVISQHNVPSSGWSSWGIFPDAIISNPIQYPLPLAALYSEALTFMDKSLAGSTILYIKTPADLTCTATYAVLSGNSNSRDFKFSIAVSGRWK